MTTPTQPPEIRCAHDDQVCLDELKPNPRNPNTHPPEQIKLLAKIIAHQGWRSPIVVSNLSGFIVAGHCRYEAALILGIESVPVNFQAFESESDELAHMIADNRMTDLAEMNRSALTDLLIEMDTGAMDLTLTGFDENALAEMVNKFGDDELIDAEPKIDQAAELQKKWGTKLGQVWELGDHRIVCGDCTDKENWARLGDENGKRICLSDPPYGIGLDYAGTDDGEDAVKLLAGKWLPVAREFCECVVFSSGVTQQWFYPRPNWVLCWFYGGGPKYSPWGFNCWQPFLCYGKDPSLACGKGCRPDSKDMNIPANSPDINHPCPKPLELMSWLVERLTFDAGDLVYEPFLGSGTTLMACENLGRKCRGIELAPEYVAVTLERWHQATGKHPEKIDEQA